MKKSKNNNGITLIALVITIIVLLILAGISIATLTGENGVLTKASTAKKKTEIEEAKEQAKLDIATWTADKLSKGENADLNDSIVKNILTDKEYVKDEEGQPGDTSFKTAKSGYEILYSELYTSKVKFTLITRHSEHGGNFEVESGTTWYDFFHEKFPNNFFSWIYLVEDNSIAEFDSEDSLGNSAYYYYLVNNKNEKVHRDDLIVSRFIL